MVLSIIRPLRVFEAVIFFDFNYSYIKNIHQSIAFSLLLLTYFQGVESGKDNINKTLNPIINQVVKMMKENRAFNLETNGYSDNVGVDALNLELSQKRARI